MFRGNWRVNRSGHVFVSLLREQLHYFCRVCSVWLEPAGQLHIPTGRGSVSPDWPRSTLLFWCAPPQNKERHGSPKLPSQGCICREMVNSSNEAEEQRPGQA